MSYHYGAYYNIFSKLFNKIRYCKECQHFIDGKGLQKDFCTIKNTECFFLNTACSNFDWKIDENLLKTKKEDTMSDKIEDKICAVVDLKKMLKEVNELKYLILSERNKSDDMECYDTLSRLEHEIRLLNDKETRIQRIDWWL